jgi:glycosyltransferase involved in cell wall biosynthesis
MDKISVIVPVYKVQDYLGRCVDSILAQTYPELEVILVDDGSPDGCGALCDRYAAQDARVRVIHKANGGLSSARNAGMDAATGTWLAFVDSDDWLDPTMLELLHRLCVEHEAQIAECGSRSLYADRTENSATETGEVTEATPLQALDGNLDYKNFFVMSWNKLYRADIARGVRFPEGRIHEDEFTTHRFYLAAQKIVAVDTAAYNYDRRREGSITAHFRVENLTDACEALRERMHLVWETPEQAGIDLDDPRVQRTVRDALADRPQLRRHGMAKGYNKYFKTLERGGAKRCVEKQQKEKARNEKRYAPENRGKGLLNRAVRCVLRAAARCATTEESRRNWLALEADVWENGVKTVLRQSRRKNAE